MKTRGSDPLKSLRTPAVLAKELLKMHAADYDNDDADERNRKFEEMAIRLAKTVLGIGR